MTAADGSFDVPAAWKQVEKLAESADSATDPVLLGALEEALRTKLDALRKHTDVAEPSLAKYPRTRAVIQEMGFQIPEPPPETIAVIPQSTQQATTDQIEQAENILRQARVHSMRGDRDGAKSLLDQAAAIAPGSPTVLEALGDEFRQQGKKKQALEYYKRAMDIGPKNVALEKKHAELTFSAFASSHSFTTNASELERVASAKSAVLMSVLIPGLGQIVMGQFVAGASFLGSWVVCWLATLLMGIQNLPYAITGKPLPPASGGGPANSMVFVPVGIGILIHVVAIMHAVSQTKAAASSPRATHPAPPTNLPFE